MAYVDLNPLRAKLCDTLEASKHTSARKRLDEIAQTPALAEAKLAADRRTARTLCVGAN